MDLRTITVNPHPARKIFRENKIPLKTVSLALELSYNYTVAILSGSMNPTPKIEQKLKMLCRELEREEFSQ